MLFFIFIVKVYGFRENRPEIYKYIYIYKCWYAFVIIILHCMHNNGSVFPQASFSKSTRHARAHTYTHIYIYLRVHWHFYFNYKFSSTLIQSQATTTLHTAGCVIHVPIIATTHKDRFNADMRENLHKFIFIIKFLTQ